MSDGFASRDAHAYVDNSLSAADRAGFEVALRRDVKIRARIEAWEAQNEAIRLAFGAAPRLRHAPSVSRPSNENNAGTNSARSLASTQDDIGKVKKSISVDPIARPRSAVAGIIAFLVALLAFAGGPNDPRNALMRRANAGLRVSTAFADAKLDLMSDDPLAVSAWLGWRFARVAPQRLTPPGWSLLGVRIVPGVDSAAALVLFEDAVGERAALLLEPTDASPRLPLIADRVGGESRFAGVENSFAYAAVGPSRSGVSALVPVRQPPP